MQLWRSSSWAGGSTLRTLFSPERSAKRFFENYMSGDWAAVYQEIDLPEGEMLDEAHFLQMAEAWEHSEYLDYQMEPLGQTDGDSLYLGYRFTYSATGSSAPSQLDVTLVRTGKTALLFDHLQGLSGGSGGGELHGDHPGGGRRCCWTARRWRQSRRWRAHARSASCPRCSPVHTPSGSSIRSTNARTSRSM